MSIYDGGSFFDDRELDEMQKLQTHKYGFYCYSALYFLNIAFSMALLFVGSESLLLMIMALALEFLTCASYVLFGILRLKKCALSDSFSVIHSKLSTIILYALMVIIFSLLLFFRNFESSDHTFVYCAGIFIAVFALQNIILGVAIRKHRKRRL